MSDEPRIPSRNTEWETPFSPVAPVNVDVDAVRHIGAYSARRRLVAILVTVAASAVMTILIVALAGDTPEVVDPNGDVDGRRAAYILYYRDVVMWAGISLAVVWGAWHWANRPVQIP
jgi:hypothetical protein